MLTKKLWATSPQHLKMLMELDLTQPDAEERINDMTGFSDSDMRDYGWVECGTCDRTYHLELTDTVIQSAISTFDNMEQKLKNEYNEKLAVLSAARQEFLSLPAPKDSK